MTLATKILKCGTARNYFHLSVIRHITAKTPEEKIQAQIGIVMSHIALQSARSAEVSA